jgi:hypothetical protein
VLEELGKEEKAEPRREAEVVPIYMSKQKVSHFKYTLGSGSRVSRVNEDEDEGEQSDEKFNSLLCST